MCELSCFSHGRLLWPYGPWPTRLLCCRTSCRKLTHTNGDYGAWPGWVASVSVLLLTIAPRETLYSRCFLGTGAKVPFFCNYFLLGGGFSGGSSGDEPACQCRRRKTLGCRLWVGKIPWRRAWHPTSEFFLGESRGQRSLEGYSPQGCKESDRTEVDLARSMEVGVALTIRAEVSVSLPDLRQGILCWKSAFTLTVIAIQPETLGLSEVKQTGAQQEA